MPLRESKTGKNLRQQNVTSIARQAKKIQQTKNSSF